MNKFRIYAWPAYATRKLNPYNFIIYKQIEQEGYRINDFRFGSMRDLLNLVISRDARILHIHWPISNLLATNYWLAGVTRIVRFYLLLKVLHYLGKKVFWTVHNIEEHEDRFRGLQVLMSKILFSNVHGFISMNKAGLNIIERNCALQKNKARKISLIHHPHYKGYYANRVSREEARAHLGIPANAFVFLFVGQIRKYKNVAGLIAAYRNLGAANTCLVIAGRISDEAEQAHLAKMAEGRPDIMLIDSFINEEEVQYYFNASSLIVNPYSKIFNSGSVFLNLSFSRPTLAPDMYGISDLKEVVGSEWVKTYSGELTADVLKKAMDETISETKVTGDTGPDIDMFNPECVARDTIEFYRSFLN